MPTGTLPAMPTGTLPAMPTDTVPAGALAELVARHRGPVATILGEARRRYTGAGLALADRLARRWATRTRLAEAGEIARVARLIAGTGAWALNLSYEWGCSTRVEAPDDAAPRLVRTLDWELAGLGRAAVIVATRGPAGPWISPTWPGFIGLVHALAPGRFAVALNQAPGPDTRLGFLGDWLAGRRRAFASRGVPPVLLLRRVADQAADFAGAVAMLSRTPVTLPVIFAVAGVHPGEAVIIERTAAGARRHDGTGTVTNHWLGPGLPGRSRSVDTVARLAAMRAVGAEDAAAFEWVAPPILNPRTRQALVADAAAGHLTVIGYEEGRPVTASTAVTATA